jgi:hypothetical protein
MYSIRFGLDLSLEPKRVQIWDRIKVDVDGKYKRCEWAVSFYLKKSEEYRCALSKNDDIVGRLVI